MAINEVYVDRVQQIYIAYFGRPADPAGLDFWTNRLAEENGDLTAIIDAFGNSAEADVLFGGMTPEDTVNTLYLQLFGRDADLGGLLFYTGKLLSGEMTLATIALNILDGAQGDDVGIIANKVAVANEFVDALDTAEEVVAYSGGEANQIARDMLSEVDGSTNPLTFDVDTTIAFIVNDAPEANDDVNSGDEDTIIAGSVASNDSDPDGDTLTYSLDTPVFGLTLNSNGSYSFDAGNAAYQALTEGQSTDVVASYTVTDAFGVTDQATLTITVNGTNEAPVAQAGTAAATEGGALISGSVVATDADTDSGDLVYSLTGSAPEGLTFNADGSFSFDPAVAGYDGLDEGDSLPLAIEYEVSDGGLTDTATLTITVTGTNDAPVASAVVASTNEDNSVNVTPVSSDVDADDTAAYTVNTQPTNGTVSFNGSQFVYTPNADYNGADSFTYKVTDSEGATSVATISVTVNAVNDAPVAETEVSAAIEGGAVVLGSVSASDIDSASLTYSLTGAAPAGLTFNANGDFAFDPTDAAYDSLAEGDVLPVQVTYEVEDGDGGSDLSTLTINVTGTNDAPVASALVDSTDEDSPVTVFVSSTDVDSGDTADYAVNSQPSNGTVVYNGGTSFTYTPNADYNGADSFTYSVTDSDGAVSVATVSLTVDAVNDDPIAEDEAAAANEGGAVVVGSVTASDIDSASLTYSLVAAPQAGLTFNANGSFAFDPTVAAYDDLDAGDTLDVVVNYQVSDGDGGSDLAVLTITVTGTNDAPVAQAVIAATDEDSGVLVTAVSTDVDADDTATYSINTQPANGTVVDNGNGTFTYTPNADYNGADEFTYKVTDSQGATSVATASVTIAAVNDAPVASDASATGFEDTVIEGSVTATDVDGDTLTYTVETGPAHGEIVLNADGTFSYTPDADYVGEDTFTYTVDDGSGEANSESNTATVTLTVEDVNEVLTPGQDIIEATGENDDVIFGSNNNLNAGDNVDAGGNTAASVADVKKHAAPDRDILVHNLDSGLGDASFEGFTLTDVETLQVNNDSGSDASYDLSNSTGLETIRNINSTSNTEFNFANMNPGSNFVNLEVINLTDGVDTSLDLRNDDVSGGADEVNLLVTDSDDDSEDAGDINIMQFGTDEDDSANASGIETVNLRTYSGDSSTDETGTLRDSDGEVRINDLNTPGATTLNILTDADLTIGDMTAGVGTFTAPTFEDALSSSLTRIDASNSNGDLAFSTSDDDSGTTTILSGTGDDFIESGDANDRVDLNDGNDSLNSGAGFDSILGGSGNDRIDATDGSQADTIRGEEGHDSILAGDGSDKLYGGTGNDTIVAGDGNNTIEGNDGADSIIAGSGSDSINAGSGNDYIDVSAGGNDSVNAGAGNDTVFIGTSLTSSFTEHSGNPAGPNGGDTLDGGPGFDTLIITADAAADPNLLDRVTGFERIIIQNGSSDDMVINITDNSPFDLDTSAESPTIIDATAMDGALTFEGNDLTPVAAGDFGDDVLSRQITVLGGGGNDSIVTGNEADSVDGNAGSDTIETNGGADTIEIGSGDDSVEAGSDNDLIIVQDAEVDTSDTIHGGTGNDTIQLDNPNGSPNLDINITLGAGLSSIETLKINDLDGFNDNDIEVVFDAGYDQGGTDLTIDGTDLDAGESLNVDASANAAPFAEDINVLGGEGADSINMGASLDSQDSVDGNGGTDTIVTDGTMTDSDFTNVQDVEQLILQEGGAADDVTLSTQAENGGNGIESVDGSEQADTVDASGYQGDISIDGWGGDDSLDGGSGNDSITGEEGHDTIHGNAGDDILKGGEGNDFIYGGNGADTIYQGSGTDYVQGNNGSDDDVFVVKGSQMDFDDTVDGGAGDDTMLMDNNQGGTATAVDADVNLDIVTEVENFVTKDTDFNPPGGGNEVIPAHFDIEFRNGSVTTQTELTVDASSLTDNDGDHITVTIDSTVDKDYKFDITGGDHDDKVIDLAPTKPNDIIFNAGDGDDTLNVDGNDLGTTVTMDGGNGTDVIEVTGSAITDDSFVDVDSVEHIKAMGAPLDAEFGANAGATGVVSVTGSASDDMLILDPLFTNSLDIDLSKGGDDTVEGGASAAPLTFQADVSDIDTNDSLVGGTGNDTMDLTADNGTADLGSTEGVEQINILESGDSSATVLIDNTLFTGNANGGVVGVDASGLNDTDFSPAYTGTEGGLNLQAGGVTGSNRFDVTGGTGSDTIVTGDGNDTIDGGADYSPDGSATRADDYINSGAGHDSVTTGNGDDTIETGSGDDTISGGAGDDLVMAGTGNDLVTASPGDDTIYGGDGNDTMTSTSGEDWLYGGSGADSINGGSGNDQIAGDDDGEAGSADIIDAGASDDIIYGGAGADTLTGGTGNDTFIYTKHTDSKGMNIQVDTITDFVSGQDVIDFRYLAFDTTLSVSDGDEIDFVGNGTNFQDAQAGVTLNSGKTQVVYQQDENLLWVDLNDDGTLDGNDLKIKLQGTASVAAADVLDGQTLGYLRTSDGENTGTIVDDHIIVDTDNQEVNGLGGDDEIIVEDSTTGATVNGGDGNDTLMGGSDADELNGDGGDDSIMGGSGDDNIDGGSGDDYIEGGSGSDDILGGNGNDTILGQDGDDTVDGGSGADSIIATPGADSVQGGHGEDTIWTGSDDDTVHGGDSDDLIYAGTGSDSVTGDDGDDTIYGGDGSDSIEGGSGADSINGGSGDDTINGGSDDDFINGSDGDDLIDGSDGNDTINGGSGNDHIHGSDGSDEINGGEGSDELYGSDGQDTINGGDGSDSIEGGSGSDDITGGSGDDTIYGDDGSDDIDGGDGSDDINGGSGADSIEGGSGSDDIRGGEGNDTLNGGDGSDEIYDNGSDDDDLVNAGNGDDFVWVANGHDTVNGGDGNDTIWTYDSFFANSDGAEGDTIDGGSGNDSILAGEASDDIQGGEGNDTIYGSDGDDTIDGGDHSDEIHGGDGSDDIMGAHGSDSIYGGSGNDTIDGGEGSDTIEGGSGSDDIVGGLGSDEIYGDYGDDSIAGGSGADTIYGGEDNDTINGGDGSDSIYGGSGEDSIDGSDGSDEIHGGYGDDTIHGGDDSDTIYGGFGNDSINGGDGSDSIFGSDGDDTIDGGDYSDTIDGGDGNDSILGGSGSDSIHGGSGNDTIEGGSGSDTIYGDSDDDVISGDDGSDSIFGGDGNDSINGGGSDDTIFGGAGDDTLNGGDDGDDIYDNDGGSGGTDGNDLVNGGSGSDFIWVANGADTVNGDSGNDTIWTYDSFHGNSDGAEGDTINGGEGNDSIIAGSGNDDIDGGSDNDYIDASEGDDSIMGGDGDDTIYAGSGGDDIMGGSGNDEIHLGGGSGGDSDADLVTFGDVSDNGEDDIFDFSESDDDMIQLQQGDIANSADSVDIIASDEEGPSGDGIDNASLVIFEASDAVSDVSDAADIDELLNNQNGTFNGGVYVMVTDGTDTYLWHDSDANDDNGGTGVTLIGVFHDVGDATDFFDQVEFIGGL